MSTLPAFVPVKSRQRIEIETATLVLVAVVVAVATFVVTLRFWSVDPQMVMAVATIVAIVLPLGGVAFMAARRKPSDEALEALSVGSHGRRTAVKNPWGSR